MKTVVVVQRLSDFADQFADWLSIAGYRVRVCTGPAPPRYRCWALEFTDCPLWQQADLLVYDPWLPQTPRKYDSTLLLSLERDHHPNVPLLIWGSGGAIPPEIAQMERPGQLEVLPLEITRDDLIAVVERLIGPANHPPDRSKHDALVSGALLDGDANAEHAESIRKRGTTE